MVCLAFLCSILLLCIPSVSGGVQNCLYPLPWSQYFALNDLYDSLNGEYWCASKLGWKFPSNQSDPCTSNWYGITCACSMNNSYTVVSLGLTRLCCRGTLPNSLSSLVDLESFNVYSNYISGTIPGPLKNLTYLSVINVTQNYFTVLTDDVFEMVGLRVLALGNNYFHGTISSKVSNLRNLTTFGISDSIIGTIPSEIGTLSCLNWLAIEGNGLNGTLPSSIGNLPYLQTLLLSGFFTGQIPSSYSNLTKLTFLYLDGDFRDNCLDYLSNMYQLNQLLLSFTDCIDSFPSILHLKNLTYLSLSLPLVYGTIPSSIGDLSNLTYLVIKSNYLTGSLPSNFNNIKPLLQLQIECPLIDGTLPPTIFNLPHAVLIDLTVYSFGTIPYSISQCKVLTNILLTMTYLSGSIPEELYTISSLVTVQIISGNLIGSISSSIVLLRQLVDFYIKAPKLTGSLPSTLGDLRSLYRLFIYSDDMTGSIPTDFYKLTYLSQLQLYMGHLTQSIPSSFYSTISQLTVLFISGGLTGSLPSNFTFNGVYLNLSMNSLTGVVPSQIMNSYANQIDISENYFTNSLPSYIYLPAVSLVAVDHNYLSGPIPAAILQSLYSVRELLFDDNLFSGSFPRGLNLSYLQVFQAQNNRFTGSLVWDVGTIPHSQLQHLDISNNQLSGTLPSFIFLLPHLTVFACASNCFEGTLPSTMCSMKEIENLIMDGLSSNAYCPKNQALNNNKPSFIRGFLQASYFQGSIPTCLWDMTSLQTLHIAGNGLTGSIPELSFNSSLIDVSISNNLVTGKIPSSFQLHPFSKQLSLSNNRLGGTLIDNFAIGSTSLTLDLSVNRISGPIPSSFSSIEASKLSSMNVLSGNLFGCQSKNEIPANDVDSRSYVCGSNELNNAEYVWLTIMGLVILVILCIRILGQYFVVRSAANSGYATAYCGNRIVSVCHQISERLQEWEWHVQDIHGANFVEVPLFILTLSHFRLIGSLGAIFILLFGLGVYLVLKLQFSNEYSTLVFQYGWIFSSAYLEGVTPTILISIFVVIISMLFTLSIAIHNRNCANYLLLKASTDQPIGIVEKEKNDDAIPITSSRSLSILTMEHSKPNSNGNSHKDENDCSTDNGSVKNIALVTHLKEWYDKYCRRDFLFPLIVCVALQCVNLAVTLVVNGSYVNTVLNRTISTQLIVSFQIGLALFKVLWNMTFIARCLSNVGLSMSVQTANRLLMSLVNFIISPCLASLFSIDSCFYYIFHQASEITSSFQATYCVNYITTGKTVSCASYDSMTYSTSFIPPFLYSFQCGSAIVATYVPILLYSYIISGILGSITVLGLSLLSANLPFWIFRVDGQAKMVLFFQHLALMLTFGIAAPVLALVIGISIAMESFVWRYLVGRMRIYLMCQNENEQRFDSQSTVSVDNTNTTSLGQVGSFTLENSMNDEMGIINPISKSNSIDGIKRSSDQHSVNDNQEVELEMGKKSTCHNVQCNHDKTSSKIAADCQMEELFRDTWKGSDSSSLLVVAIVAFFWSLMFLDMVGSSLGYRHGLVTMIVFCVLCVVLNYLETYLFHYFYY